MKHLVDKYVGKIISAGLSDDPLIGGLDAELVWNREGEETGELKKVFDRLSINSLLYAEPAEPYASIIHFLASGCDTIKPYDCETRTFMHDLPVVREFDGDEIASTLRNRKSVIVEGRGIVTWGTVSPEQAYIFFSSACFACFVKFYSDYMMAVRTSSVSREMQATFDRSASSLFPLPEKLPDLMTGPFESEPDVRAAMCEAGYATVHNRLVDSFFGNISYQLDRTLYISQTGSSLDELENCIDPCPLDDSSCAGITASSELVAHRGIIDRTGVRGILHGHPQFSVIMSMKCERDDCDNAGKCHVRCTEERFIGDIPIVPGEVGTGPTGLCNTLPPAIERNRGAIVYGHGLFTLAESDFNKAFSDLVDIERMCRKEYFRNI